MKVSVQWFALLCVFVGFFSRHEAKADDRGNGEFGIRVRQGQASGLGVRVSGFNDWRLQPGLEVGSSVFDSYEDDGDFRHQTVSSLAVAVKAHDQEIAAAWTFRSAILVGLINGLEGRYLSDEASTTRRENIFFLDTEFGMGHLIAESGWISDFGMSLRWQFQSQKALFLDGRVPVKSIDPGLFAGLGYRF